MNNINKPLSDEWFSEIDKKKSRNTKVFYADSCQTSRNHKHSKSVKTIHSGDTLPLSGSEPHYNPDKWNKNYFDKLNHNCYAYVLDDFIPDRPKRPQPGHRDKNINTFRKQDYTREEISRRAIYDNPSIYCSDPKAACKKGYYKGVLIIDRYNNYHWLRQDSNGYWSHKPGQLEVTNIDADGKLIKDPSKANFIYDKDNKPYKLIYSDIGPYFCIPSKEETHVKIQTHTCGQCGGSIHSTNKNGVCYKCRNTF
jgi:hypothetical protein